MQAKTIAFLVMSSALNAAFGFFMFAFAQFAASPDMQDVTMGIDSNVLNAIGLTAMAAVFLPWILERRQRMRAAVIVSLLPLALLALAALAFAALDS